MAKQVFLSKDDLYNLLAYRNDSFHHVVTDECFDKLIALMMIHNNLYMSDEIGMAVDIVYRATLEIEESKDD